jgi:hypothetical protein
MTNLIVTFRNSVKAPQFEFWIFCTLPDHNLTLRWVSVTEVVAVFPVLAVLVGIILLFANCLIAGAITVSEAFTLLSIL